MFSLWNLLVSNKRKFLEIQFRKWVLVFVTAQQFLFAIRYPKKGRLEPSTKQKVKKHMNDMIPERYRVMSDFHFFTSKKRRTRAPFYVFSTRDHTSCLESWHFFLYKYPEAAGYPYKCWCLEDHPHCCWYLLSFDGSCNLENTFCAPMLWKRNTIWAKCISSETYTAEVNACSI